LGHHWPGQSPSGHPGAQACTTSQKNSGWNAPRRFRQSPDRRPTSDLGNGAAAICGRPWDNGISHQRMPGEKWPENEILRDALIYAAKRTAVAVAVIRSERHSVKAQRIARVRGQPHRSSGTAREAAAPRSSSPARGGIADRDRGGHYRSADHDYRRIHILIRRNRRKQGSALVNVEASLSRDEAHGLLLEHSNTRTLYGKGPVALRQAPAPVDYRGDAISPGTSISIVSIKFFGVRLPLAGSSPSQGPVPDRPATEGHLGTACASLIAGWCLRRNAASPAKPMRRARNEAATIAADRIHSRPLSRSCTESTVMLRIRSTFTDPFRKTTFPGGVPHFQTTMQAKSLANVAAPRPRQFSEKIGAPFVLTGQIAASKQTAPCGTKRRKGAPSLSRRGVESPPTPFCSDT
jgi:hypothetical protein